MYSMPRRDGSPGGTPNRIRSFVFIILLLSLSRFECPSLRYSSSRLLPTTRESGSLGRARPSQSRDSFEFAHPIPARVDEPVSLETQLQTGGPIPEHKSKASNRC